MDLALPKRCRASSLSVVAWLADLLAVPLWSLDDLDSIQHQSMLMYVLLLLLL